MDFNFDNILNQIIRESINEVLLGKDDSFTPYTSKEREQNFSALTKMNNPSYDVFKKWRTQELKKGRKSSELSWNAFIKEVGNDFLDKYYASL